MKKIIHFVEFNAGSDIVFKALTSENGLKSWWTTKVTAENSIEGIIHFTFRGDFNPDMEITKLDINKTIHWKCISGHDNWLHNTFSFDLTTARDNTHLLFVQNYAQELNDAVYGAYNYNWGYYLESLRLYCDEGKGKPFNV